MFGINPQLEKINEKSNDSLSLERLLLRFVSEVLILRQPINFKTYKRQNSSFLFGCFFWFFYRSLSRCSFIFFPVIFQFIHYRKFPKSGTGHIGYLSNKKTCNRRSQHKEKNNCKGFGGYRKIGKMKRSSYQNTANSQGSRFDGHG